VTNGFKKAKVINVSNWLPWVGRVEEGRRESGQEGRRERSRKGGEKARGVRGVAPLVSTRRSRFKWQLDLRSMHDEGNLGHKSAGQD